MISVAEAVNNQKTFLPKVSQLSNVHTVCYIHDDEALFLDTSKKRFGPRVRLFLSRCSTI